MNPQNKIDKISHGNNEIIVDGELDQISKNKLLDFLKTRTEKEKNLILVISKNEIAGLKNALSTEPDSLKEFLEIQEKETITSSEIMSGSQVEQNIGGTEKLKVYIEIGDEASYRYFFEGESAIFKGLNISEDAKRNFAVGANFFIINHLNTKFENANLSGDIGDIATELLGTKSEKGLLEDIPSILAKGENLYSTIEKKWDFLSEISFSDIGKTFDSFFGSEKLKVLSDTMKELQLESDGENNGVFMNPLESHDFMKEIFETENITKEQIKQLIENKNGQNIQIQEQEKIKLKNIGDKLSGFITPEMGGILGKGLEIKQFYEKSKDSIKDSILGNKTALSVLGFLKELPWIGEYITMFLEFLGINNISELLSGKNFEASKKSIETNIIKKGTIFEGKTISENFMENNLGNNDNIFLDNINYIIGKKEGKDFGKEIENLFKKNGSFIKFYNKIKASQGLGNLINSDKINYNELSKTIDLYKNYQIILKETPSLTIQNFITQLKEGKIEAKRGEKEREKTIADKTKEIAPIIAGNKFEIGNNNIEYIFESNGTKYKIDLSKNGTLFITGGKKMIQFSGGEEIFNYISKFRGKLNNTAFASDFGKDKYGVNPKLEGLTIKEILLNGIIATIYGQDVNEKGLKDKIINKFLNSKGLNNNSTSLLVNNKTIQLTVVASNGFEENIKSSKTNKKEIENNKTIKNKETLSKGLLVIDEGKNKYEIHFGGNNKNSLIIHINSNKYKLDETYNIDLISEYPSFKVKNIDGTYFLISPGIKDKIKINDLVNGLKKNNTYILKNNILQDLILEKV